MAIVNRTLDQTQQNQSVEFAVHGTVTANTYEFFQAPHPMSIEDAKAVCLGLSGAPTSKIQLSRFIAGSGATAIDITGALTHAAFGTSGTQTYSLPAAGNSLLYLQTGDVLQVVTAGSNAALTDLLVTVVLQNTQDILSWY